MVFFQILFFIFIHSFFQAQRPWMRQEQKRLAHYARWSAQWHQTQSLLRKVDSTCTLTPIASGGYWLISAPPLVCAQRLYKLQGAQGWYRDPNGWIDLNPLEAS